ncbi:MAG: putative DNA binding CopG/RHH family protein [Candidatus Omnitrophota bacterium]|jgi:predicted DNA binding CopG/RHH family protein
MMRKAKLSKEEEQIERDIDQYVPATKKDFGDIVKAIQARKKDAVLNIRISEYDLNNIKRKANQLGVKYQTFISEILHKVAKV